MSSRSLAAARARRAGDTAPPVSGNRPGTSVGSAAAFSNMPPPPGNVRVARQPQQPPSTQQRPQSAAFQQIQQQQQQSQNGLPFTKLSISDAIGLITLRLGRVEQWVIETEHENEGKNDSSPSGNAVDNSVLVSLLNRLETVEKRESTTGSGSVSVSSDEVKKLTSELGSLNERYTKFCDEANKQTLTIAKHTEQLFRFERELVETKDILKTFMLKYDNFVQESNEKLADYEFAISEIEKSIAPTTSHTTADAIAGTSIDSLGDASVEEVISSDDLKNLVKQELSGIN
jgi:hypothetical protein